MPPLKSLPLSMGEDVVNSIRDSAATANRDIPYNRNTIQDIFVASISNSIFSKTSTESLTNELDDDPKYARTLRYIESTSEDTLERMCQSIDSPTDNQHLSSTVDNEEKMQVSQDDPLQENDKQLGNALVATTSSWTDPLQEKNEQSEEEPVVDDDRVRHKAINRVSSVGIDNHSFESLWNEKQRKSSLNFSQLWDRFEKSLHDKKKQSNVMGIAEEDEEDFDFEVVNSPLQDKTKLNELQEMVEILCRLSTECGLDAQGFVCRCKSPLVEISKATVCGFDALYYCSDCISNDKFAIPARIIYNWDFTQYHVSKRAADFFADYQFKPFIDFKVIIIFF